MAWARALALEVAKVEAMAQMLAVALGEVALEEVWLGEVGMEKVASGVVALVGVTLEEEALEELV